jgi:hypothetical protein
MVLEYASSLDAYTAGVRQRLLIALNPHQAQELAEGLLMAAESASMGQPPTSLRS